MRFTKPKGLKGGIKMAEKRFEKIFSQGMVSGWEIWVDTQTGVNYVFHYEGHASGLTPLLGADGKPVVTPMPLRD